MKPDKASVTCPKCGHTQLEPVAAYSSSCKKCRQYFRLQDLRRPQAQAAQLRPELRRVRCFTCGTDLDVPATAQSTMCKRCSSHLDLQDYHITSTVSKNFRTKGRFVIDETGCLLNTDSIAGEVILKGKIRGKMSADVFQIFPTAEIKGSFKTARLLIPSVTHFRWLETISVHTAEIAGELVANLQATSTVVLKSTARFFGNIEAAEMIVESGAIVVGNARIGVAKEVLPAPDPEVPAKSVPRTEKKRA